MTSAMCQQPQQLSPLRIQSDGKQVEVVLPGVETDPERLAVACELAERLADQQSGGYR